MTNKNQQNTDFSGANLEMPNEMLERRKQSRQHDWLYRVVVGLNIVAWLVLISALVLFHYARPEFITGVQNYWEIDGRDFWSKEHLADLLSLLQICLFITVFTIALRSRRNRRKKDRFGVNILILFVILVVSLVTLYMTT